MTEGRIAPSRTPPYGRFLLAATVMLIPLQDHFPAMGGVGFMFVMFGMLGVYAFLHDPRGVDAVWLHPAFAAAYVFIALTAVLEFVSPLSKYDDILRFILMVGGAVCIAALCQDRPAIDACLYGYIGAGLWLSVLLFASSYGALSGVSATDYTQASLVRAEVMSKVPLQANPNGMAFNCVQGGVVAFAFALTSRRPLQRNLFVAIAILCLVASSLAMSRGGIAIGLVSCATVLYMYGWRHGPTWIIAGVLGLCILFIVPSAVWTRMEFSVQGDTDQLESRSYLYTMAMQNISEYVLTGVGSGNSEKALGNWSTGVHNGFLQITINWGLPGLLAFILMIWHAYRCLPKQCGQDQQALALVGVVTAIFLMLFFIHNFHEKFFSFGLGMLVAWRCWISPVRTIGAQRSIVSHPMISVPSTR